MDIMLDCLPCLLKQSLDAVRKTTNDERVHKKVVLKTAELLSKYKEFECSPALCREIHNIVKQETGNSDPYFEIKQKDLAAAKRLYTSLNEFLSKKEDTLYWALKVGATGNNLDSAVYSNVDIKKCVGEELEKEFALCNTEAFKEKLKTAKSMLIIGDNTGETVFDKVMIEHLPKNLKVFYAVRNSPVINDVTEKEAIDSGLHKVATIISSGCNSPAAILSECSDEFLKIFNSADIIISKGQGNFEALSEEKGNLFFLLKAKCSAIAKKIGVPLGSYIFKKS